MVNFGEIIIFGCGGVGSWLAHFVARNNLADTLSLVDFDVIEAKNLKRQLYYQEQIGDSKVGALSHDLKVSLPNDTEQTKIVVYNRNIKDEIDLTGFNRASIAILATDNLLSKRLLAEYFKYKVIVNCDKNFVEVKNHIDRSDSKAWDLGGGYSNGQDIVSNIFAANYVYSILNYLGMSYFDDRRTFKRKVESDMREQTMRLN